MYIQSEQDKIDATNLRKIVSGETQGKEAEEVFHYTFPNVDIKWTKDDVTEYLTGVYQLNQPEIKILIDKFPENYISKETVISNSMHSGLIFVFTSKDSILFKNLRFKS